MDYMVGLFGEAFNQTRVIYMANMYSKYMRDKYKVHLQKKPTYELPLMSLEREWKNLLDDSKDKRMKGKEGKTPPDAGRYMIYLVEYAKFPFVLHKNCDI